MRQDDVRTYRFFDFFAGMVTTMVYGGFSVYSSVTEQGLEAMMFYGAGSLIGFTTAMYKSNQLDRDLVSYKTLDSVFLKD